MGEDIDRTKGTIKQAVGHLTGNKKIERAGKRDKRKGRFEGAVDDAQDSMKDLKYALRYPMA